MVSDWVHWGQGAQGKGRMEKRSKQWMRHSIFQQVLTVTETLDISLVPQTEIAVFLSTPSFCLFSLFFHSSMGHAVFMLLRQ